MWSSMARCATVARLERVSDMKVGIGHSVARVEDRRLLQGRGRFTDDIDLPGQLHGAMVLSPHPHARIVGIDVKRVYAITFALCIGITGLAGALVSPVLAVQPFQGPPLTLKAFAITAMAGLGSVRGALGGAMVLGLAEAGLAVYVDRIGTNLAVVASFVLLVVALVLRPQGLFRGLRPVDATAS